MKSHETQICVRRSGSRYSEGQLPQPHLVSEASLHPLDIVQNEDRDRIEEKIASLGDDPRPSGCTQLTNQPGWRIRIGQYRVVYLIDDDIQVVEVTNVGNRGDIYKQTRR